MNKKRFDERQKERRNSIGNQMFILLFYALLFESGLYRWGVRWVNYPGNVMIIITVFMLIYLGRVIAANAFLPPEPRSKKVAIATLIAAAAAVIVFAKTGADLFLGPQEAEGGKALLLFIASGVSLFILAAAELIRRANKRNVDD